MDIDLIFIFTDDKRKIADKLLEFSGELTEGSNRVHVGQGTTNRKFYFGNFFLEILCVHYEQKIKSDLAKPIKLWQRAKYKRNQFYLTDFVLKTVTTITDCLKIHLYCQPDYFPNGMKI
ncbi:MAG: hypothetical protein ACK5OS_05405 [Chryseotalea sp.]|jgi:hypothetical protein